ncbi:MAG: cryptochrome/photolyase family protein [Bryobacterales bacterium]|nr:cryptochrome/photolyase family protein [Bryobacterales bacterium]
MSSCRRLLLVLGDQLDAQSAVFDGADPAQDVVWMAEVAEESTHVWTHKARIVLFLSAMRHFAQHLRSRGFRVQYTSVGEAGATSLGAVLARDCEALQPRELRVVQPGEFRVLQALRSTAERASLHLEVLEDTHFLCSSDAFRAHAQGRKQLRMEYFYREMRRSQQVLMEGQQPAGGTWNYDQENRKRFGKQGPGELPSGAIFVPDAITREVMSEVAQRFASHPGKLESFAWPVTRDEALAALRDFIEQRLPRFGDYQDAMWTEEPFLYHARLASSLNLKLLHPREVVEAAEDAWRRDPECYPLASVEGFIRQVLGWREYVRGIYWLTMPEYLDQNALGAQHPLPAFYWTGDTDMQCLRQAIGQTLEHGYAHHIQRLMVTGLYAMLLGVHPRQVHEWYLAVYVDAVEWVELPNTLGMSQFADGGMMASKPYAATGKYIQRMSNYCEGCRYKPEEAVGAEACPFTTLYWDFLARHREHLASNQRMQMQLRNLHRMDEAKLVAIQQQAATHREMVLAAPVPSGR